MARGDKSTYNQQQQQAFGQSQGIAGQDFQNQAADWSNSALDHRHRVTFSPTYDLRIFENKGWVMKNVVGNWRFLGTYTYQSGEYATVQSGVD